MFSDGMGRPPKLPDESRIVELATKGHVVREIAAILDVSERTLYRKYWQGLEKGRYLCPGAIRSKQVEVALAGNATTLIWLGKQLLRQRERVEERVVIEDGNLPVSTEFATDSSADSSRVPPKAPTKPN